jgi:hypothetical protein
MSVNNLIISRIESQYTPEYIINTFWNQEIAKINNIYLFPYRKGNEYFNIAYISVDQWCDTEAAYNFIQRLKSSNRETRIVHHDDEWWCVQINTNYDRVIMSDLVSDNYYEVVCGREILSLPIKGINYEYYSIPGALHRILMLKSDLLQVESDIERNQIEIELYQLETELLINHSVNNSNNVTIRSNKFSKAIEV